MICKSNSKKHFIPIHKPTHSRVVVTALEVVHPNLRVVVIATVAVGVDGCDVALGFIVGDCTNSPCIVGVAGYDLTVGVGYRNNIALEVL